VRSVAVAIGVSFRLAGHIYLAPDRINAPLTPAAALASTGLPE
jgi:hypothetical protein